MISYSIEPDAEYWIPVPRAFPEHPWSSKEQWAQEIAEIAIPDEQELREVYRQLALDVADNQMVDADHTLWYSPEDGHAMGTASLVIEEDSPEMTLFELARPEYESATPVQTNEYHSEAVGQILQLTSVIAFDMPKPEDESTQAPAIGHVRTVARAHGLLFVLEAYDSDLSALSFMMDPMVDLFDTFSFGTDDNED